MVEDICALIILLVVCTLWVIVLPNHQVDNPSATATRQRLLKPRTPVNYSIEMVHGSFW